MGSFYLQSNSDICCPNYTTKNMSKKFLIRNFLKTTLKRTPFTNFMQSRTQDHFSICFYLWYFLKTWLRSKGFSVSHTHLQPFWVKSHTGVSSQQTVLPCDSIHRTVIHSLLCVCHLTMSNLRTDMFSFHFYTLTTP